MRPLLGCVRGRIARIVRFRAPRFGRRRRKRGDPPPPAVHSVEAPAGANPDAPRASLNMAIDITAPINLKQLEDHLWASADLFRNKVSNQKDYILALLFFKRAS